MKKLSTASTARVRGFGLLAALLLLAAACAPEPAPPPPAPPPPPTEGVLVSWSVAPGAHVGEGQVIATIRIGGTSGALRAPQAGTMTSNRVAPGSSVGFGATVAHLADTRATFSAFQDYVTVAAPGVKIASTVPATGYGTKSGTSMAAPYVSATAALLVAKCPGIDPDDVVAALVDSAEDLGASGYDHSFGWGMVRADDLLAAPCPAATALGVGGDSATAGSDDGGADPTPTTPPTTAPPAPSPTAPSPTGPSTTSSTTAPPPTPMPGAAADEPEAGSPSDPVTPTETTTPVTATADLDAGCVASSPTSASSEVGSAPGATEATDGVEYLAVVEEPDGERRVQTFAAPDHDVRRRILERLRDRGLRILTVERDDPVYALAIDDPVYRGPPHAAVGPQWGIDRVGFEPAWTSAPAQGSGVRVAIVDSGVQANHPDLGRTEQGGAVAPGADCIGATSTDERTDSGDHGTHVAGIAGARDNTIGGIGGAPKVTIVPVRVLNGTSGATSAVIAGIYWAANPAKGNADVINLSLGSGSASPGMHDAIEYAVSKGVTVVAAAGNCGCSSGALYPAAYAKTTSGMVAVAATAQSATVAMPSSP